MIHVEIKIQDFKDKDKPLYPELNKGPDMVKFTQVTKAAILQNGTAMGKSVVHLAGEMPDGTVIALEITNQMLQMVSQAGLGAAKRWGEDI